MPDLVANIQAFVVTIPREKALYGGLKARPTEKVNAKGYFVRAENRTVYPSSDRSIVIKMTTESGLVGWGETYGIVAPGATLALIEELLGDFVIGRDPMDREAIHDDLYDMQRVRGYNGGYYLDALAGLDIALWDLAAKQSQCSVAKLLGGVRRTKIPAYISGLPKATLAERAEYAKEWQAKGFNCFKFASPFATEGVVQEVQALRSALGEDAKIACDLLWAYKAHDSVPLIQSMAKHGLWFAEAPVPSEDIDGLAWVANKVDTAIAVGEEWRTAYDAKARISRNACHIVQPEMGHKGITEFMRIARYAEAHHLEVIPHATIGTGIFMAASLQASATIAACSYHEFQHQVFLKNLRYVNTDMACENGFYSLPSGPGLGVELDEKAIAPYVSHVISI
ncbi:mandelate racemase/muconate lactonizing enzyme family protein [Paraglaciecola arctica]|uniref:mandelate racemase/muconate lactonizing enzyme family protein n=1 Tax=Paraglaciecola arctica TaxID=1128911 RepID=UPI001C071F9F|nr:mandelate racemase/muconate lactonizing enzyme family protein [Paraglaciecola arctica]MBU3005269.1 mandelate racemase/muconate lactonizing enzyme family protein [Paraglaciecola arctica]